MNEVKKELAKFDMMDETEFKLPALAAVIPGCNWNWKGDTGVTGVSIITSCTPIPLIFWNFFFSSW